MSHQPIGLWAVFIMIACSACSSGNTGSGYYRSADPYCQIRCGIQNIYGSVPTLYDLSGPPARS